MQVLEAEVQRSVCGQGYKVTGDPSISANNKCLYIHHFDPYLLLSPFKIEVLTHNPIRIICHDLFSDTEIKWIVDQYIEGAYNVINTTIPNKKELVQSQKPRTIQSFQNRFRAISYTEKERFAETDEKTHAPYFAFPLSDPYAYTTEDEKLLDLSRRIEMVTKMNITTRHGSDNYQLSQYGVAGRHFRN